MLVTDIRNIRYLSGFTGSSAFMIVTGRDAYFYTDFRYTEQARNEVRGCRLGTEAGGRSALIKQVCERLGLKRVGFEATSSYSFYEELHKKRVLLKPVSELVEGLRLVKESEEIALIKKAISRAEAAFQATKPYIRPGITERAVALRLEDEMKQRGCRRAAFDIIVASGRNSSMPHAGFTNKKIAAGELVIIDWGGEADGYYSDMTRTLLMDGTDLGRQKRIYEIVNSARQKAIAAAVVGVESSLVDAAARDYISAAGYGDHFGHGTGHGIGLEVHEAPRVSWAASQPLKKSMVFSIEPGIYLPGTGGVRIEDLVLIEKGGPCVLTGLSRRLEVVKG